MLKLNDKVQHFLVCFLLTYLFNCLFSLIISSLIVLVIGILKEIYDKYFGSGFCWKDLLADILGILTFIILYNLL
jgi:hypothetical protein